MQIWRIMLMKWIVLSFSCLILLTACNSMDTAKPRASIMIGTSI